MRWDTCRTSAVMRNIAMVGMPATWRGTPRRALGERELTQLRRPVPPPNGPPVQRHQPSPNQPIWLIRQLLFAPGYDILIPPGAR
jgi:hypothetical protein